MKIFLMSAVLLFIIQPVRSQVPQWMWADGCGGEYSEEGMAVATDAAGNIYVTGYFSDTIDIDPGPGSYFLQGGFTEDIFVLKLNPAGRFIWAKSIGGTAHDRGNFLTVDSSANLYVTGKFAGTVDFNTDTGTFTLTSNGGNYDAFLLKLDSAGHFIRAQRFGGPGIEIGISIAIDINADVILTGTYESTADFDPGPATYNLVATGGTPDVFIARLDSSGIFTWAKRLGGLGEDWVFGLDLDASGNIYTTGGFEHLADFDPGPDTFLLTTANTISAAFVSKLDGSGNFTWAKAMDGPANDYGLTLSYDASGNGAVYVAGPFAGTVDFDPGPDTVHLTAMNSDLYILKLDTSGNFIWVKHIGATGNDQCLYITTDNAGNSYSTGNYYSPVLDFDPDSAGVYNLTDGGSFVLKLDSDGNFVWVVEPIGGGGDVGRCIAPDPSGYFIITGSFSGDTIAFGADTLYNVSDWSPFMDIYIAKLDTALPTGSHELQAFQNEIIIYPNPAGNEFTVGSGSFLKGIEIYNLLGEKIYSAAAGGLKAKVNSEALLPSLYLVKVETEKGVAVRRILVE